jgi:hypothetical protein
MVKKPRRKSEGKVRKQPSPTVDDSGDSASEPEVESILKEKSSRSKSKRTLDSSDLPPSPKKGRLAKGSRQTTHVKNSRRKSMPEKAARKVHPENMASSSLSSKKRKFEPPDSSEEETTVTVPLTKRGPPRGVKKSQKPKLNSDKQDQSVLPPEPPHHNASLSSVVRSQTPPGVTEQNGLSMESLFSSPVARTMAQSSGFFSNLAADSEHESNSGKGSNKSRTSLTPSMSSRRTTGLPSHRDRAANPRVKVMDNPDLGQVMKGAISVKAKLLAQKPTPTAVNTSSRPSSSLQQQHSSQSQGGLDHPSRDLLSSKPGDVENIGGMADMTNGPHKSDDTGTSFLPLSSGPQFDFFDQTDPLNLPDFEDEPMETGTETITEDIVAAETTV